LQKSKQNPIREKVPDAKFEFLTEVEQRASSLVESLHLLTTKASLVQAQISQSDLQMTLDCAKRFLMTKIATRSSNTSFLYEAETRYGNLYHEAKHLTWQLKASVHISPSVYLE